MLRKNPDPIISTYVEPFQKVQTERYFTLFVLNDDTIVNVFIAKKYSRNTSSMLSISGVAEIKMCKTQIAEISVEMISSVVSSQVIIAILESALFKYDELLSE